jgi:Flp pilus assembly protein TadD
MASRKLPVVTAWQGLKQTLLQCKALYQDGRMQEAEVLLREALVFAPSEPKVWAWLGQVQQRQGKAEAAEAFAQARCLLVSQSVDGVEPASVALAELLWQQGAKADALAMLNVLIQQRRGDPLLLNKKQQWEGEQQK